MCVDDFQAIGSASGDTNEGPQRHKYVVSVFMRVLVNLLCSNHAKVQWVRRTLETRNVNVCFIF